MINPISYVLVVMSLSTPTPEILAQIRYDSEAECMYMVDVISKNYTGIDPIDLSCTPIRVRG